ncbi:MAG: peptidylprolyl isomerase [Gammaproteobacteria bacterium]
MPKRMYALISALILAAAAASPAAARDVEMRTGAGVIVISVDEKRAPLSAANFLQYVRDGFFDGLIFHRVIPGFVIQGGGFTADMQKRPTRPPIKNEAGNGRKNAKYTLSMARTNDPHSATSQFFINLADNANLDYSAANPGYAVFGEVVEGREVVDAIAAVPTQNFGRFRDVPAAPVMIEKATVK